MRERVAIVEGVRTPFCKAMGVFRDLEADDLGAFSIRELIQRVPFSPDEFNEVIIGNVMCPSHAYNVGRVMAVKGGVPDHVPAITVSRNCASGMEALVIAAQRIELGLGDTYIAGGSESMSHVPILYNDRARNWLFKLQKAKSFGQMLALFAKFRPSFLKPVIPAIADPLCGKTMGQTAEILSRDFGITREEQDQFAMNSQKRAFKATEEGIMADELHPVPSPKTGKMQLVDDGVRGDQTLEQLLKLRPVFEKLTGTVTAGNSSQVTDGAAMLAVMKESKAKSLGLKPLGYLTAYSYVGLDPARMGLGPAFAIAKLLRETGMKLKDFELFEINEAFAAQVLAVRAALASEKFCLEKLSADGAIGELDLERLNVNGGAIALGHPLGGSGARIVLTLLKELKRRGQHRGIASMCVGGGQGEAVALEVD
ncbi:MAG: putative acetyl-CoA acyltransferase [Chlamydiae bacterium]|nr:putative acetyl-CoA acyltransferase [Chlamydiota bacterium]